MKCFLKPYECDDAGVCILVTIWNTLLHFLGLCSNKPKKRGKSYPLNANSVSWVAVLTADPFVYGFKTRDIDQ